MRQIKFRGRRVDNGEFVYGSLILAPNGSYNTAFIAVDEYTDNDYTLCGNDGEVRIFSKIYPVIPETVGQFTELRDNKRTAEFPEGQEIYDGDILKYKNCTALVAWDDKVSGFITVGIYKNFCGGTYINKGFLAINCEVIGNIYENGELLTGENN